MPKSTSEGTYCGARRGRYGLLVGEHQVTYQANKQSIGQYKQKSLLGDHKSLANRYQQSSTCLGKRSVVKDNLPVFL